MRQDIAAAVRGADIRDWRPVEVEYADRNIEVRVPPGTRELRMPDIPPLARPEEAIRESFEAPIGTPPLPGILESKGKPAEKLTVCIATSDITRPVPYKGDAGILDPLLAILHGAAALARRQSAALAGVEGLPATSLVARPPEQEQLARAAA